MGIETSHYTNVPVLCGEGGRERETVCVCEREREKEREREGERAIH